MKSFKLKNNIESEIEISQADKKRTFIVVSNSSDDIGVIVLVKLELKKIYNVIGKRLKEIK